MIIHILVDVVKSLTKRSVISKQGKLTLDNNMRFSIGMCLSDFEREIVGLDFTIEKPFGMVNYRIHSVELKNERFGMLFGFHEGFLVSMALFSKRPEFPQSWDRWTEEGILAEKKFYDAFLAKNHVKQGNYDFGSIISIYDPKGGFSHINISNRRERFP